MNRVFLIIFTMMFFPAIAVAGDEDMAEYLDKLSVTVRATSSSLGTAEGSGTIIRRKIDGKYINFVWTAAHVVEDLQSTKTVWVNGKSQEIVFFEPVSVLREVFQDDELIGTDSRRAVVIKYDREQDLALLRVLKRNYSKLSAKFYLDKKAPRRGTPLCHVGSLLGKVGANSNTDGIMSSLGRKHGANDIIFDQSTVTAVSGSSGGGVFLKKDGRYVGMLVSGYDESDRFNLIVPVRRMLKWAKKVGIHWALDPTVPMPSWSELEKLPILGTYNAKTKKAPKKGRPEIYYLLKRFHPTRRRVIKKADGSPRRYLIKETGGKEIGKKPKARLY